MQNIVINYIYNGFGKISTWTTSSNNPPAGRPGSTSGNMYAYSEDEVKKAALGDISYYYQYTPQDMITINGVLYQSGGGISGGAFATWKFFVYPEYAGTLRIRGTQYKNTDSSVILDYAEGDTMSITQEPKSGYEFENWSLDGKKDTDPAGFDIAIYSPGIHELTIHYKPTENRINISSEPSGAAIYVDKWLIGKTPTSFKAIRSGIFLIKITLSGFKEFTQEISVTEQADGTFYVTPSNISAILQPLNGVTPPPVTVGQKEIIFEFNTPLGDMLAKVPGWNWAHTAMWKLIEKTTGGRITESYFRANEMVFLLATPTGSTSAGIVASIERLAPTIITLARWIGGIIGGTFLGLKLLDVASNQIDANIAETVDDAIQKILDDPTITGEQKKQLILKYLGIVEGAGWGAMILPAVALIAIAWVAKDLLRKR